MSKTATTDDATERRPLKVDAVCTGCQNLRVKTQSEITEDDNRRTFWTWCSVCSSEEPHNIVAFLTALNREEPKDPL